MFLTFNITLLYHSKLKLKNPDNHESVKYIRGSLDIAQTSVIQNHTLIIRKNVSAAWEPHSLDSLHKPSSWVPMR